MAEQVQTGGLMQFRYPRQIQGELDPDRRDAIEAGYAEADERKKREKKDKLMLWVMLAIMIVLILGYIVLKNQ